MRYLGLASERSTCKVEDMCFRRCTNRVGYKLLIFALLSITANIVLYFPYGETRYAAEHHLSKYVECLQGILGGGLLVLIPAAVFIWLYSEDCGCVSHEDCGKGCAMVSAVLAALVGMLGSGYCVIISALGLHYGPYCFSRLEGRWTYPFAESSGRYLLDYDRWPECEEPYNIVQWNVTFFSLLLVFGALEFLLCLAQIIRPVLGGACGSCCSDEETNVC